MLFMGDYEGHAALKALLATDDAQNSKYKADVWVLPHHGAALQLEGRFLIWLKSMYVSHYDISDDPAFKYQDLALRGKAKIIAEAKD